MTNTIECPLCGSNVLRTKDFENKINSYLKQQNEAEKTKKELQFHIKTLKAQLSESRVNTKEIEANALEKANKVASEKIRIIKEEAELKTQAKAEEIASKRARHIEDKLKEQNALKLKKEKAKLVEQGASQVKEKYEADKVQSDKEKKAYQIQLERMKNQVEDLNKKLKASKDVELKGEAQEDLIEDHIKKQFPECKVKPVGKGALGDDVHVTVINSGKKVGTIGIESKDTQNYSSTWVENLKNGMTRDGLDFAIIVTTSVPKNFSGMNWYFGGRIVMIKMNFSHLDLVLNALIQTVIHLHQARTINSFSNTKQGQLYSRITHPSLPLKIKNLLDTFMEESLLIDRDTNYFEKSKGLRVKNHNLRKDYLTKVFSAIAGGDEKISSTLLGDSDEGESKVIKIEKIKEEAVN